MRQTSAEQIELPPAMPKQRRNTMIVRCTLFFALFVCALLTMVIVPAIRHTTLRAADSTIIIAAVCLVLGTMLYLVLLHGLCRQHKQFQELQAKAQAASTSKSNFLAKTSHEIRTPMNAIMGMTELLLHRDIPADAYQDALNIKHTGFNLLAIIDAILDFSKIESGHIQIHNKQYQLSSLLNDVINIIRVRMTEKPVRFTVTVSSKLPNHLIGDVRRIRQVLLNLLSNALKYTHSGHISLTVAGEHMAGKKFITLRFAVSDTGIGIKQEDIQKLFTEFTQVDAENNAEHDHEAAGTGLGLAIGKNLCRLMNGDITVDSTYGTGSVFTAVIPQEIFDMSPLAAVSDAETKATLLFENRAINLQSITASLQNLGVPVTPCANPEIFFRELRKGTYAFAFNPSPLMPQTQRVIAEHNLPTIPVLLADSTTPAPQTASVLMPAYALPIAQVLNGMSEPQAAENAITHFSAPHARVLIVDDIAANLTAAQGLLSIYHAVIDAASNGPDAIALAKKTAYDIIFIAHMMHGMDGIETAYVIRSLNSAYQAAPIIALAAHAATGMKEMFVQNGFNDYLSKPLEIARLTEVMETWIPAKDAAATSLESEGGEPAP